MKSVLLLTNDQYELFDTIADAQTAAKAIVESFSEFQIYCLHSTGTAIGIEWKPFTVLTTPTKQPARFNQRWTAEEEQIMDNNLRMHKGNPKRLGEETHRVAKILRRTYHAVYCKAVVMGLIQPTPRKT